MLKNLAHVSLNYTADSTSLPLSPLSLLSSSSTTTTTTATASTVVDPTLLRFYKATQDWKRNWEALKGNIQDLELIYEDSFHDRKTLLRDLDLLQFDNQLCRAQFLRSNNVAIPGVLHTCCGDHIDNDEALLHRRIIGSHFSAVMHEVSPKSNSSVHLEVLLKTWPQHFM